MCILKYHFVSLEQCTETKKNWYAKKFNNIQHFDEITVLLKAARSVDCLVDKKLIKKIARFFGNLNRFSKNRKKSTKRHYCLILVGRTVF